MHKFLENPGNPINTFVLPFVFTDKVKEAVESIWKCHSPLDHRLILIDNSGEDFADRKWLEDNSHLYIRSYRNLGPAMAFNLGIKIAKTKYVTIFSDDARAINREWFLDAYARIKVFDSSAMTVWDSPRYLIISAESIYPQKVSKEEFYNPEKQYSKEDYLALDKKYGSKRDIFGLACAIAKKSTWIYAGLLDEEKYIYWIDGVFMAQANQKGVQTVSSGVVFHFGDASHKGKLVATNKYQDSGMMDGEVIL